MDNIVAFFVGVAAGIAWYRLHGLQDGVERIVQGKAPKTGIHLALLPVWPKMAQAAKWFLGSRAAAPILSAAMTGCVYQYCAVLAYIERGGKTAYGGECLAALAAGFLVWKMVSVWNRG